MNKRPGQHQLPAAEEVVAGDQPQIDRHEGQPGPAGAGTPVWNPADLCGWSSASIRALKRASRSAQQTASASATIQPNRGASCSDQRKMISAGAVPNAILSRQLIELGAEPALRPKQPGDAAVDPVEHAGDDDAGQRLRAIRR